MFNFFKKKKDISDEDLIFLSKIVNKLPFKYSYLKDQANREFILRKEKNEVSGKGTYTLVLNAALESKFANKSLPQFFIIRDIFIWNSVKKHFQ